MNININIKFQWAQEVENQWLLMQKFVYMENVSSCKLIQLM